MLQAKILTADKLNFFSLILVVSLNFWEVKEYKSKTTYVMKEIESLLSLIKEFEESVKHKNELSNLVEQLKEVMPNYYSKPLTTKDVCEKYQVSTRTVSRWVASGKITPISNHGKYLFNEDDVRNVK